tara:strand:+ start:1401 stop:1580 length:180 start_codon:yes stop_codon:yes gene_type:complete
VLSKRESSRKKKEGIKMNGTEIDKWSEKHVGSLALVRTVLGFVNVLLALIVIAKLFGAI